MDVIEKQLDYLNQTMKDTASEANSFLLKYHFGGLIAVITLLNVDLVLTKEIKLQNNIDYLLLALAASMALILSYIYFKFVVRHYMRFSQSHRKLKYKYELTLHQALCNGEYKDYQYYLEQSVSDTALQKSDEIKNPKDNDYDFKYIADYLLNHHRLKFSQLTDRDNSYLGIAMSVIVLTLSIRAIFMLTA